MNLRDFQYLMAIAEHQHFGKAADVCCVSQPALSMQLKKLEETLGVQLIERDRKQVRLTEGGEKIVAQARNIMRQVDELKITAKTLCDPFAGAIKLGVIPTVAPYFLPKIIPLITRALPKLQVYLYEEKTDVLLKQLDQGSIDCAILALPVVANHLQSEVLMQDDFVLAVAKNHPWAKQKHPRINLKEFDLLLLQEGHCLSGQALEYCETLRAYKIQDFRATSLETLRQMVVSGLGITLLPRMACRSGDGLVYLELPKPKPSRTLGLVWRSSAAQQILFKKMAEIMQL